MAIAEDKLAQIETRLKFRSNIEDLIVVAKAICRPGQSVEDLVGILQLSVGNDMLLEMLIEKVELNQQESPAVKK